MHETLLEYQYTACVYHYLDTKDDPVWTLALINNKALNNPYIMEIIKKDKQ